MKNLNKKINPQAGQSLIEILIALAVGVILIGAATLGIAFMLRSTAANERLQVASGLARDLIEKSRSWAASDWQNIYNLEKGTSTQYFLMASGTSFAAILGEEGVLENEVRVGLIGKWGFDEATGTTAYDSSGNRFDGLLRSAPVRATSSQCVLSGCLIFSSARQTSVSITSTSTLNPSYITVMMRIKLNAIPYTSQIALNKEGQYRLIASDVNASKASARYATTRTGWGSGQLIGTTTLLPNVWYHVAMTYNGTRAILYLNGNVESTLVEPSSGTLLSGSSDLFVGANSLTAYNINGSVDDVRIYNRALSATEVKNIAESKIFSRRFTIQNTCRQPGETDIIAGQSCSAPYFEDPSTQQVSVSVRWPAIGNVAELKLSEYITRWRNEIFHEENWSGGAGQEGPITIPNGKFSSSTNIDINSYGIIKVKPH